MRLRISPFAITAFAGAIVLALTAVTGCNSATNTSAPAANSEASLATLPAGEPGVGQTEFDSAIDGANALVAAAKAHDRDTLNKILGPSITEFVSGDKVEDEKSYDRFVARAGDHLAMEQVSANSAVVDIGKDNFPFPIPLTRLPAGKWFFDTEAGKQEILARRVGRNENQTIDVCRAYVEAQREYASEDRDGSGVLKYAQHFISRNGHDGLYWDAVPGAEKSPFDPVIAQANMEGYMPQVKQGQGPQPYFGYVYKILTKQGSAAPGGRYDYIINGNMIAGFALVACPVEYGNSGVYTFIISHQGKLYQKDLGPDTTNIVRNMSEYNPDTRDGWTPIPAPARTSP